MQEKEDIEQVSLSFECTTPVKTWESIIADSNSIKNFQLRALLMIGKKVDEMEGIFIILQ